jgi:hypothetical protein
LLKSESGQLQLLRIGPAPNSNQLTPNLSTGNQTIRLQTVPAVSRFTGPPLALRKTIVTQQVKQKQNVIEQNSLKKHEKNVIYTFFLISLLIVNC